MPEKLIVAAYIVVISLLAAAIVYAVTWLVQYVASIVFLFGSFALMTGGGT